MIKLLQAERFHRLNVAICNFSNHICYLLFFKKSNSKCTAQSTEHFPKNQKLQRECTHGFCSMK